MNPLSNKTAVRAGTLLGFLAMAAIGWKMAGQPEKQATAPQEETDNVTKRPPRIARKSGPPEALSHVM
jgi:hypothetical protein